MAKKVKWGIGEVDEPDALSGFSDYDGPVPPKGTYNGKLTLLRLKKNRNGDDMLNGLIVLDTLGEDREKRKVNGAPIWFNQNITEQGLPYVKQFLDALGVSWKDFQNRTLADDEEPANITRLGSLKMTGDVQIRIATKIGSYQGDTKAEVQTFLKPKDAELEDEDGDEDEEDEVDDLIDGEEEDEEDAPLTEAELKAMSLADVKAEADALEITGVKGKANLIAAILEAQEAVEEDEEDEEADEDEEEPEDEGDDEDEDEDEEGDDALREELEALGLAALKKRARANGSALKDVKALDEEELVELIISQEAPVAEEDEVDEEDEEDEEEDEEPEPPAKPAAKKSAKGKRPPF